MLTARGGEVDRIVGLEAARTAISSSRSAWASSWYVCERRCAACPRRCYALTELNWTVYLLWVAHNLERIGDRVTNV